MERKDKKEHNKNNQNNQYKEENENNQNNENNENKHNIKDKLIYIASMRPKAWNWLGVNVKKIYGPYMEKNDEFAKNVSEDIFNIYIKGGEEIKREISKFDLSKEDSFVKNLNIDTEDIKEFNTLKKENRLIEKIKDISYKELKNQKDYKYINILENDINKNNISNIKWNIVLEGDSKDNILHINQDENDVVLSDIDIYAKPNSKSNISINLAEDVFENSILCKGKRLKKQKDNKNVKEDSSYIKNKKVSGYRMQNINILAGEKSEVNIDLIMPAQNILLLDNIFVLATKHSVINMRYIILGSNMQNISHFSFPKEEAKINVKGIYVLKENEELEFIYNTKQENKKTTTDIYLEGALLDEAKKTYKGIIDLKNGCNNSEGKQLDSCIQLSNNTIAKSVPVLLANESKISAEHGMAIGDIDKDKKYYIQTRGYNEDEAKALLVYGKFSPNIELMLDKDIKNDVIRYVKNVLENN